MNVNDMHVINTLPASDRQTDRHHLTARTVLFICMHQQVNNLQNWFV